MNLRKATIFICILWVLIIVFWVSKNQIILSFGREVYLKTVPVDPKDLFMGDYVILNYEIGQFREIKNFELNKQVYVTLKVDEKRVAKVDHISYKKPSSGFYIKGKTSKCDTIIPFWHNGDCIKYGIESYYVKEHTGHTIENELRDGAFVRVSIDKNGNAKVKGFEKR